MRNITEFVILWAECCRDVWNRWFVKREDGAHEFAPIEQSLLEAFVTDKLLEQGHEFKLEEFWGHLRVKYLHTVAENRSFCVKQKGSNIFGESRKMNIQAGSIHSVRGIDTIGTMSDGVAYVEVRMDGGFILEPFENVEVYFSDGLAR